MRTRSAVSQVYAKAGSGQRDGLIRVGVRSIDDEDSSQPETNLSTLENTC